MRVPTAIPDYTDPDYTPITLSPITLSRGFSAGSGLRARIKSTLTPITRKLAPRKKPYYRQIERGLHLGYKAFRRKGGGDSAYRMKPNGWCGR